MATIADLVSNARVMVRDFPHPFDGAFVGDGATFRYKLAHPLIVTETFSVVRNDISSATTLTQGVDYTIDGRNGYLNFTAPPAVGQQFVVVGYYYDWFYDDDLTYFANNVVGDHAHGRDDFSLSAMEPNESEVTVIVLGTIVQALWSLLAEVARDIDVHAPEGVSIPASERYHQIQGQLAYYQNEYNTRSEALGVGLARAQVFDLRRVSMVTGRLVPLYVSQEIEDTDPPQRAYPPIDPLVT